MVKDRSLGGSSIAAETRNRRRLPCKELACAFQGEEGASWEDHVVRTRFLVLSSKIYMASLRRGLEKSSLHMAS